MTGAAGRRSVSYVARSKPDGYTILLANMPVQLFDDLPEKDSFKLANFSWIAQAVTQDGLVAVKEDSPLESVNDLKSLERFQVCFDGFAGHNGLLELAMQKTLGYKGAQFVTGYHSSKAVRAAFQGLAHR